MIIQSRHWRVINPNLTKKVQAMRRTNKVKSFNRYKLIPVRALVPTTAEANCCPPFLYRDICKLYILNLNIVKPRLSSPEVCHLIA